MVRVKVPTPVFAPGETAVGALGRETPEWG